MVVNKIAYDPVKYVSFRDYMFLASKLNNKLQNMIRYERLEQAIQSADPDMAARLIAEAGWPNMAGMSLDEIDKVLIDRRNNIFKEIEQVCPEDQVVQMMRLKYDYHNIKAIIKSDGAHENADTMLSSTGRYTRTNLREDYLNNDYRDLTPIMAETIREARDLMARTQNPRAVDLYIDRMYFKEMFELAYELEPKVEPETPMMAPEPGEHYAVALVREHIDRSNLLTSVRVVRMKKSQEFLRSVLIENGNYSIEQFVNAAFSGDALAAMFKDTFLYQAAVLGQEAIKGGPITMFEKECAEARLRYLANIRMMYFDARAVFWYLNVIEANILNVRMVLAGLAAGVSPEKLKERLRQTYV